MTTKCLKQWYSVIKIKSRWFKAKIECYINEQNETHFEIIELDKYPSTIFNFLEESQTTKIERRKNQDEFVVLDWLAPC